ncbi:MAG: ATPase [Muribaculaceae bacterium]|nr:ATPase [Muribaculaceae bacterium]
MTVPHTIIIADAGGTKTDWVMLPSHSDYSPLSFRGEGLNVLQLTPEDIEYRLSCVPFACQTPEIYFYGAGCATTQLCDNMYQHLKHRWPSANRIEVASDLIASGRALFGDNEGLACILGTGSNSGLFIDGKLKQRVPSLGFILGDEGSGASLGRRFISDFLKGILSPDLTRRFSNEYRLSLDEVLQRVYRTEAPAAFLAGFVPFLAQNIAEPQISVLIASEFDRFFERNICLYSLMPNTHIGFTGGIASTFSEALREAAIRHGYTIDHIISDPLQGLITYHTHFHDNV